MGFQPPFSHVKCTGKALSIINGNPVYREAWNGKNSRGSWINIQPKFRVQCVGKEALGAFLTALLCPS